MAASRLPEPGTEHGPCDSPSCGHADCRQTRELANRACRLCGKAVGYGTRFYRAEDDTDWTRLVHAVCLERKVEQERAPRAQGGTP